MKILHIIHSIDKRMGGSVYAVQNIIKLEKKLGLESHILTLNRDGADVELEELAKVHLMQKSFPARFSRSEKAISWLKKNAENYDLSVIHSIWGFHQIESAKALSALERSYVVWPHGSLDPFDLAKKKYLKKLIGPFMIHPMLKNAEAVVCTSEKEKGLMEFFGSALDVTQHVLPLPVTFENLNGDRSKFRKKYNISDEQFVFLFLSRVNYKKGLELTLNCLKKIVEDSDGLAPLLIIAGSGDLRYEAKIRKLVRQLKLEKNVLFSGFLSEEERNDAYVGAECYILASLNENFGIAPIESLASGTPILISKNVYIWKELSQDDVVHVCEYNEKSLLERMRCCLDQRNHPRDKLSIAAKSVAERYSIGELSNLYMSFYMNIDGEKRAYQ